MATKNTGHILATPRLILRRYRLSDLDDYFEYVSQAKVGPMCGWEAYTDKAKAAERLKIECKKPYQFAIVYKENNKVIGAIELRRPCKDRFLTIKLAKDSKEIGYLLNEKYWGKGIMPEAMKAIVEYAFTTLGISEIVIRHAEANVQSGRVQEKLGFKIVDRMSNWRIWLDGEPTAGILRKLTRDDYLRRNGAVPKSR